MYYQSNKFEEAKEYLADHCEKNPKDLPLRYKYLTLLDRLADEDEQSELLKAKNDFPEEIKVRELLTKFYEDSGEPEKAAVERDEMLFTQLTPPLKTLGSWQDSDPVNVTLKKGKNIIQFSRNEPPQKGVAVKSFTLKPAN